MWVYKMAVLAGWMVGTAAPLAVAPADDFWSFAYRVLWVALGVAAGTMSRYSTWVVEAEDGRKVIDRHLMMKDLTAIGLYFVGGFAAGAATGWMPELIGLLSGGFAAIGIVGTRKLIFEGLGAVLRGATAKFNASSKPDGDAP